LLTVRACCVTGVAVTEGATGGRTAVAIVKVKVGVSTHSKVDVGLRASALSGQARLARAGQERTNRKIAFRPRLPAARYVPSC
jgi:hypothetical protein